ncbi:hypothetical protein COV49_04485 [Candidatus Falkowbacteria bacterium CG11_big_fil_rev_8_21_14_0_20_39_10]|uniref:Prepilin-type N-terminal cleavage/methylation domain-containing protein n=1 Tax=Candidatus Falkowbacteria bacterium CG11_big_fil_rev_8_21_14_0_20_39_10 TaxID=1974570 RepID=A0A2M6K7X8_9BACT|nr:MAG: hypothetical protein COV49_04485 [Candidatus Falkowbacteria bacterium CG11_big_fil_rev_8_21_14_0_20_39_10]
MKTRKHENTKKLKQSNHGFTILEILVVIFIITVGMVGVLSLIIQNIQVQYINKNILIASQLSQEGLELIRNQRDNNFKSNQWYMYNIIEPDETNDLTIYFDGSEVVINYIDGGISNNATKLDIDENGYYTHEASQDSGFRRLITLENNEEEEFTRASSVVQWRVRGKINEYTAETILYDWR